MTISSTINRTVAATNGATTVFPFGYYFLLDQDLVVLKTEIATGIVTTLVLTSDYTVTGAADPAGGNVTITPALATGFKITIYRDPEAVQPLDLVPNDQLPSGPVEQAFDRLTMVAQRVKDLINRSFRLNDGDVTGTSTVMPAFEASKYLRVAADGLSLEMATVTTAGAVATASETSEGIAEIATQTETDTGTDNVRIVTPLKFVTGLATWVTNKLSNQTTAEAGVDNTKLMTPLRTAQAITALAPTPAGSNLYLWSIF